MSAHHTRSLLQAVAIAAACLALPRALALRVNDAAPAFPALQAAHGKVVLVDFWASWCGPCREALPAYDELRQELAAQGFEVIAVDVDQRAGDGRQMLAKLRPGYPQVEDAGGALAERYQVPGMPTAYLIDRRGAVRQIHTGFNKDELGVLRGQIRTLLEEP